MADAIFADPRLAEVYDPLDSDRSDLDVYVALAEQELSEVCAVLAGDSGDERCLQCMTLPQGMLLEPHRRGCTEAVPGINGCDGIRGARR